MKHGVIACVALVLALAALPASAQTPVTPANKIAWDQSAPTLAEAQGYTYKYYPDTATTGITLAAVTCAGATSPYQCEVPFPAFTLGSHTVALTAGNAAGESAKSASLAFTFVLIPGTPANLRIK